MQFAKQKRILLLFISGCILIVLLWFNGQYIANKFGWGWENNFPDHLHYQGRNYSLGVISGCRTRTDVEKQFPAIMQFGTLPMLFGSSYPLFAPANQVKSHGIVISIFAEESETCYKTYTLEGGP
jgi:hypothetical protein